MAKDVKKSESEVPNETPVEAAPAPPPASVRVDFNRWFVMTGRPAHHKAGMRAFTNTSGKKTVDAWNALFAGY